MHIAYGDGETRTISANDLPDNDNAAGERFGFSMDTVDWNDDGCTDLFIGAPFENWSNNTLPDAGVVVFIPGSPAGLDVSLAKNWSSAIHGADSSKANTRFGWDLAAGLDAAGEPYLVVGMPGRDTTTATGETLVDIGSVIYIRATAAKMFNQNSASFSDSFEPGDMFGYSVAASESGFAVGVPGESAEFATGTIRKTGTVFLVGHNDANTTPTQIAAWGQGSPDVNDHYEDSDMYGYSLDMVDYISTGGGASRMMIAVGAPGEAIGSRTSAGLSMVMWSPGTGITEYRYLRQDADGSAADDAERGDAFGAAVAMVNRTPGQITSVNTLLLTVGVPGEDADGRYEVGQAQLFSMTEDAAQENNLVREKLPTTSFTPADGATIGRVLHATKAQLFVTAKGATGPAVYGIPWDNLVAGGTAAVKAYTPATFGLTNSDVVSFGASLA
ncbi:MAG: hypothetical protein HOQ24_08350 [Mycobacteriaceae bacterium]|nr:hypothetical protein [Mycobacteriaceae bacterium]